MSKTRAFTDTLTSPGPADLVSFSVICRPRSGANLQELRERLSLKTLENYLPREVVLTQVEAQLRSLGFEVFPGPSAVVSARGSVALFQSVFGGQFSKRTRRFSTANSDYSETAIVLRKGSRPPSPSRIDGALSVVVMEPPLPEIPLMPPRGARRSLRLPGDVALLTGASPTHRRRTAAGQQATGGDVVVAVLDWGFAKHPYYERHEYQITRVSASDVTAPPDEDLTSHGTRILSCLLACAPDVHAYGIRMGTNPVVALTDALNIPGLRVVSISWSEHLDGKPVLPEKCVAMQLEILKLVEAGVTVVAAAGNGSKTFPAMMPEVIAVGGVDVDGDDGLAVSTFSSSFTSTFFKGRWVPDLCGVASEMMLPNAGPPFGWESVLGGTSSAAPQVAGIVALLLQKAPALTPDAVRGALMSTAFDVVSGTAASGQSAAVGPDRASGAGLVDALGAWQGI